MKKLNIVLTTILLLTATIIQAQKVDYYGVDYTLKGKSIYMDKVDVTSTLSRKEQANIKDKLNEQILAEKNLMKVEKQRKADEKEQIKAEKEIKSKARAQGDYGDAQEKYKKELKRRNELRDKGKLSPKEEEKWAKKLRNYDKKTKKIKARL